MHHDVRELYYLDEQVLQVRNYRYVSIDVEFLFLETHATSKAVKDLS